MLVGLKALEKRQAMAPAYEMFGLHIRSDFRLPVEPVDGWSGVPDVTYRRVDHVAPVIDWNCQETVNARCNCSHHRGAIIGRVQHQQDGTWIAHEAIGTCHISSAADLVDVYVGHGATVDENSIGLFLAGQLSAHVLHRRGIHSLHSSAVVIDDSAIAFLGVKGQGKSTLAACCLQRGAVLLTDDILPLDCREEGIFGLPSLPVMKLWPASVNEGLGFHDDFAIVSSGFDKRLFPALEYFPFAPNATRLRAIYTLNRYDPLIVGNDDVVIEPLSQLKSLSMLLDQVLLRDYLTGEDYRSLIPILSRLTTQTPVRMLHYPDGFEHQDRVYARIIDDLWSSR